MATSYTRYSGGNYTTSAIYTVPSGKIAKIIINFLRITSGHMISIGDYDRKNASGQQVRSSYGSGYPPSTATAYETEGILICRSSDSNFNGGYMQIRDTHILVPTQTVVFDSSGSNLIEFLVIEEDQ